MASTLTVATPRKIAATATADATLTKGRHTPVDATAAARTMTLPTGAPEGSVISVEKTDTSQNTVTVTGSIRGAASTIVLTHQFHAIELVADSTGSWRPTADHRTRSQLEQSFARQVAPDWAVLTKYAVGDLVVRGGHLYRVNTAHTTGATYGWFTTGTNSANYTDLGTTDGSVPHWFHLRGNSAGADAYDSNPHITIESYQRPMTGPFGESLRFLAMQPQSKQMISWWFATDPSTIPNPATNPLRQMVWWGAHYGAQDDADGVHGHISLEVPDSGLALRSRFGIDFLNNRQGNGLPGAVGADITSSYFSATDVTFKQGDGSRVRISAGIGSSERVLLFSAFGAAAGQPPGWIDPAKDRWGIVMEQTAEPGSNAGSDFIIRRYTDAGAANGTTLFLKRANGHATFGLASDLVARVAAVWGTDDPNSHGFYTQPAAAVGSGFAHFAAKAFAVADRIIDVRVAGDAQRRFSLDDANGKMLWGNGTAAPDTQLGRSAADTLALGTGDSLKLDGTWNGGHLVMGTNHIWIDATGAWRRKASAPTSDTDGTVI